MSPDAVLGGQIQIQCRTCICTDSHSDSDSLTFFFTVQQAGPVNVTCHRGLVSPSGPPHPRALRHHVCALSSQHTRGMQTDHIKKIVSDPRRSRRIVGMMVKLTLGVFAALLLPIAADTLRAGIGATPVPSFPNFASAYRGIVVAGAGDLNTTGVGADCTRPLPSPAPAPIP